MSAWSDLLGSLASPDARASDAPATARRTAEGIRFGVDVVAPATSPCPEVPLSQVLSGLVGAEPPHVSTATGPFVASTCDHPLVAAINRAYVDHRPLVLTPDAIWLTLAHGIALHVDNNAEGLRDRFVAHDGRRPLTIQGPADGKLGAGGWDQAIQEWSTLLQAAVRSDLTDLFVCDFSTTTPQAAIASRIVMLSALRHYFELRAVCVCGIPEVELRGTPADWRRIRARVDRLHELDLGWWAGRLRPVLDAFIETAEGRPDPAFWQQIWIPLEVYGGETIVGWICELFPYVRADVSLQPTLRNPLFASTYGRRIRAAAEARGTRWADVPGLSLSAFPGALSVAPLVQEWPGGATRDLELVGGLLGVRQVGLDLEPVAGWLVRDPPPVTRLFRRLREAGTALSPPAAASDLTECSADMARMTAELGGLRLPGGVLHASADWQLACFDGHFVTCFADLPDGRVIGAVPTRGEWGYLAGRLVPGLPSSSVIQVRGEQLRLVDVEPLSDGLPPVLERLLFRAADSAFAGR